MGGRLQPIEAAELMEHFQWVEGDEAKKVMDSKRQEITEEIADVAMYLFEFCNLYNIDLSTAMQKKLKKTIEKYPVNKSKGSAKKYTEYTSS